MLIGDVKELPEELLKNKIFDIFGIEVKIKEIEEEPLYAYDPVRHQCYSSKILKEMLKEVPEDAIKVIGITNQDLCTPVLSYVFGEAQLGGKVGIVSTRRLKQEFYGLSRDDKIFFERLLKEVIHEFGHTFSLVHCTQKTCVMSLSTNVLKIDEKNCNFCDACQELIRINLSIYRKEEKED
jgi:archaemetzincin